MVRRTARTEPQIVIGREGMAKRRRFMERPASVSVVKPKAKKPDPRVCMPGGVTKSETSRNVHQMRVTAKRVTVMLRRARMLQRLYGETFCIVSVSNLP